jgi:hypothetical protein
VSQGRRRCDWERRAADAKGGGSIAQFAFVRETNRMGRSWTWELVFTIGAAKRTGEWAIADRAHCLCAHIVLSPML